MKTFPYTDIADPERRRVAESYGFTIVDRAGLAEALELSPNRISELSVRGILSPANENPIRFDLEHAVSCYDNYRQGIGRGAKGRFSSDRSED